jgi:predicted  nucleic acid-binding Zn-ribbon protein
MTTATELAALNDADRWLDRVRQQRDHLPERATLLTVESELQTLAQALKEQETLRTPLANALEEVSGEADVLRTRLATLRQRLDASTGAVKDVLALQHEVETLAASVATFDDRELAAMEALEPVDAIIRDIRASAQPLVAQRTALREAVAELTTSLDEEITALQSTRDEVAERVAPALRTRYEAALRRAGVSGAANVDGGRCDGCRIALAPLDLDRWRAALDEFVECAECGRILLPAS